MTNRPLAARGKAACAIAVMAKASAPGLTKTRLSPPLSFDEAAALNTAFLKDIAGNIALAAKTTPIATYMAFGPPKSEAFFAANLPPDVGLFETWLGDFGQCLSFAIDKLFALGHTAACVLNADSPTLPTPILLELAEALDRPGDRMVIGPAEDGGYYVLGLKAANARLFEHIAWSTSDVFRQTLQRAEDLRLPVHILPEWYDVDDAMSLRRLYRELFEPSPAANGGLTPNNAPHTRDLLFRMIETGDLKARLTAWR
jgi:rSAM/selenodomain-associated transferase 1